MGEKVVNGLSLNQWVHQQLRVWISLSLEWLKHLMACFTGGSTTDLCWGNSRPFTPDIVLGKKMCCHQTLGGLPKNRHLDLTADLKKGHQLKKVMNSTGLYPLKTGKILVNAWWVFACFLAKKRGPGPSWASPGWTLCNREPYQSMVNQFPSIKTGIPQV